MSAKRLFAFLVLFCCFVTASKAVSYREAVVSIPVPGAEVPIAATVFKPNGNGPFPLAVVSHGAPATAAQRAKFGFWRKLHLVRALVSRGFAVIIPIRRGFGATGGAYVASHGGCKSARPRFYEAGMRAAEDIVATVRYASKLSYVDNNTVVLVGQSAGGIASIAAASMKPAGVVAVANFSGGRGGRPDQTPGVPCHPNLMADAIGKFARRIDVPVLWHYVENDRYFSPAIARQWFTSFTRNGGNGRLVVQPPFGKNGHGILVAKHGPPIWGKAFDAFLAEHDILVSRSDVGDQG